MTLAGVLVVDDEGERLVADIEVRNFYGEVPLALLASVAVEASPELVG